MLTLEQIENIGNDFCKNLYEVEVAIEKETDEVAKDRDKKVLVICENAIAVILDDLRTEAISNGALDTDELFV